MDVLLPAIYAALTGDATLDARTSEISQFRHPQDPKLLAGRLPVVVFTPHDISDNPGTHGAATDPEVEVSVWAYGPSGYAAAVRAAQRVDEIFLGGLTVAGGAHTRWGAFLGWQQVDQPNPETIRLRATFRSRYWGAGRVAAVAAARDGN